MFKIIYLLFFSIYLSISAQEKLGGQEIIEKLDRNLAINEGLTLAKLSIKKGNHETHFWKVNIFKLGDDILYTFEVTHRKPVAKFLSIKRGQKLIYYNVLSGEFFQIIQLEKLRNVLNTSFSFIDLSYYLYEANYNPENISPIKTENSDMSLVKMSPIFSPSYEYLELYADNNNFTPKKIDFIATGGYKNKSLNLKFGNIKVRDGKSISETPSLVKLEMTDFATNNKSILEFYEWNKNVNPDKILYEMRTMYEK